MTIDLVANTTIDTCGNADQISGIENVTGSGNVDTIRGDQEAQDTQRRRRQ